MDGTVAAYRLPHLMAGDSLVLKQDSSFYEHFYRDLKPYQHYVPIQRDLTDLLDKVQWARDNDAQAKNIAQNAQAFVNDNLLPGHIYCYYAILLHVSNHAILLHVSNHVILLHVIVEHFHLPCPG